MTMEEAIAVVLEKHPEARCDRRKRIDAFGYARVDFGITVRRTPKTNRRKCISMWWPARYQAWDMVANQIKREE